MRVPVPLVVLGTLAPPAEAGGSSRRWPDGSWPWSPVRARGAGPSGRQGHASVEVGRRIYVVGGCSQDIRCHSDVHVFDTDALEWTQEAMKGEAPEPRGGHTASLVSTDVFVFGGANSEETFGDVHCLDLVKRRWTRAPAAADDASSPQRRTNHAAAVDAHGRIYIFGGYGADGRVLNDMWILKVSGAALSDMTQPVAWAKQAPTGTVPEAREGHSLTLVDRKLVLFGGYASCGKVMNDLHLYDVDAQHWTSLQVAGAAPLPRQAHSAVRHGRDVVVAGGCNIGDSQPTCFHDVWSLNLIELQWTQRSGSAEPWTAREGHSATFVRGRMFAFGGCQLGSRCYGDVAVLDSFEPCPAMCGGRGECVGSEFCRCTAPGFTGHDCMQPLTCRTDCSGHGACSQDGRCVCDNGWRGEDCSVEVLCPGGSTKCSNRGLCLPSGQCQCFPGFAGPACASAANVSCPLSCSGHGQCHADGRCACRSGWTGESCSQRLTLLQGHCPGRCCGHGACGAEGCRCEPGWHGPACSVDQRAWVAAVARRRKRLLTEASAKRHAAKASSSLVQVRSLLAAADEAEQLAAGEPPPEAQDVMFAAGAGASCAAPVPVTTEDFGVGDPSSNPKPSDMAIGCEDNCNFRGLCDAGVCYCQPGYYGPTCDTRKESQKDTLSLKTVLIIAGGCLLISFVIVLTLLNFQHQRKLAQEVRQGFNVNA